MKSLALQLAVAICLTSGCVCYEHPGRGGSEIFVEEEPAPPPMRIEVRTVAPGPEHVWVDGHWAWRGREYVWMPGHWDRPARHGAHWIPGHWERRGHRSYWIEGHWD